MRLFFSEYKSDYPHYIFPYSIWAMPDEGEQPSRLFTCGFLPNSRNLDRFYLCRQVRVRLEKFSASSENRRIMRKGEGLEYRFIPRDQFHYSEQWREFCKKYADEKFGPDVMSYERLDSLFQSRIISHVMVYADAASQKDIGLVMLYVEPPAMAFYYYSFYDLDYFSRNMGMYMMTCTVQHMKNLQMEFIYLGSCYSRNALYKTQFEGFEFFNGFRWSSDLEELKSLIERDAGIVVKHLLESDDFMQQYYPDGYAAGETPLFQIPLV
jgi:arginyl-tRNA--protein-N-Asp/Glu arginylyltransferase